MNGRTAKLFYVYARQLIDGQRQLTFSQTSVNITALKHWF